MAYNPLYKLEGNIAAIRIALNYQSSGVLSEDEQRIRDVSVPDLTYAPQLPVVSPGTEIQKRDMLNDLANGKSIPVTLNIGGSHKNVLMEASPLKRGFLFYDGKKKVTLEKLLGKGQNNVRTLNKNLRIDIGQPAKNNGMKLR